MILLGLFVYLQNVAYCMDDDQRKILLSTLVEQAIEKRRKYDFVDYCQKSSDYSQDLRTLANIKKVEKRIVGAKFNVYPGARFYRAINLVINDAAKNKDYDGSYLSAWDQDLKNIAEKSQHEAFRIVENARAARLKSDRIAATFSISARSAFSWCQRK